MNNELNPPTGFEVMADFNRLYSAYLESRKGKRWKCAVVRFEVNVLENIMFLHFMLTKHKYRPSPYSYFLVHEPKERLACATTSWGRFYRRRSFMTTTPVRRAREHTSAWIV